MVGGTQKRERPREGGTLRQGERERQEWRPRETKRDQNREKWKKRHEERWGEWEMGRDSGTGETD